MKNVAPSPTGASLARVAERAPILAGRAVRAAAWLPVIAIAVPVLAIVWTAEQIGFALGTHPMRAGEIQIPATAGDAARRIPGCGRLSCARMAGVSPGSKLAGGPPGSPAPFHP